MPKVDVIGVGLAHWARETAAVEILSPISPTEDEHSTLPEINDLRPEAPNMASE
jgi:hypothetical protein